MRFDFTCFEEFILVKHTSTKNWIILYTLPSPVRVKRLTLEYSILTQPSQRIDLDLCVTEIYFYYY